LSASEWPEEDYNRGSVILLKNGCPQHPPETTSEKGKEPSDNRIAIWLGRSG